MIFESIQKKAKTEWEDFNNITRPRILIGSVTCGRAAGALLIKEAINKELSKLSVKADIYEVGCLGMCYAEPLVEIGMPDGRRVLYNNLTEENAVALVNDFIVNSNPRTDLALATTGNLDIDNICKMNELPMIENQVRIVLRNTGIIVPTNINHYIARAGYSSLQKALRMKQKEVIDEVMKSGLRGRGGAGFSTGKKWEFAYNSPSPDKYMICNADEGDPGAFMDRSVLESDPHTVLEGLVIAAYAIGANNGYVYCRTEYPLALERLELAIKQAEEYGFLGKNIMNSGFDFNIKIKEGAGAFVCGEETALIASIEGKRGMPMPRPPFPAVSGLHKKPTNINNVETLANIPVILNKGAEWFSQYGTEKSKGTKTFALAGKINRTGLIEVPMGIKLSDIVYKIGGGIPDNKKFKAIQSGGPSGGCIPKELLDLEVDYDELIKVGSIMGSGGMIIMDEDSCMVDIARYFLEFTQNESCGKCTPCRMGSQHLLKILTDITEGRGSEKHIPLLKELSQTIKSGSLCGLGQTIPNPVLSTLRYFTEEFEKHINKKQCGALVCKDIISSPCQYTCPINQDVPSYLGYIARNEFDKAIEIIRRENPLPGICGRTCPHPCETKCEAGKYDSPISIRSLKRFASDYELKNGVKVKKPKRLYDEKIAIIGSGPAGLSAAYFLANKGYKCTIFESLPVAGGMLAVGIPDYRLPTDILNQEIDYIKQLGVEIKTSTTFGKDITMQELLDKEYKVVFLATGAHNAHKMAVPGEKNPAVLSGVKFLRDLNLGVKTKLGEKVAVIGGGNVAVDSARSAVRLGSKNVFVIYRRSKEEMPAAAEEIEQLEEEGIKILFLTNPVKIETANNTIKGIECVRMKLGEPDNSGRRRPIPIEGSEVFIECDNVISAIGQFPDLSFNSGNEIKSTKWNTIVFDEETFNTSKSGVFAGGDAVTGPSDVISAIAHGKHAANSIYQYLRGKEVKREYKVVRPAVRVKPVELTETEIEELKRPDMPCKKPKSRIVNFSEVEDGFTEKTAVMEAKRCLRCDNK